MKTRSYFFAAFFAAFFLTSCYTQVRTVHRAEYDTEDEYVYYDYQDDEYYTEEDGYGNTYNYYVLDAWDYRQRFGYGGHWGGYGYWDYWDPYDRWYVSIGYSHHWPRWGWGWDYYYRPYYYSGYWNYPGVYNPYYPIYSYYDPYGYGWYGDGYTNNYDYRRRDFKRRTTDLTTGAGAVPIMRKDYTGSTTTGVTPDKPIRVLKRTDADANRKVTENKVKERVIKRRDTRNNSDSDDGDKSTKVRSSTKSRNTDSDRSYRPAKRNSGNSSGTRTINRPSNKNSSNRSGSDSGSSGKRTIKRRR